MKAQHGKISKVLAVFLCVLMLLSVIPLTAFAKYNNEYYSASGTNYIYKTCLYYSSDSNGDAENWLRNNGWTPVGINFNAGDGKSSKYIHLGVTYTTNPKLAVRAFAVRDGDRPEYYDATIASTGYNVRWYKVGSGQIEQTPDKDHGGGDGVVDLNKGAGGNDLTLYISVDPNAGPPCTEFKIAQSGNAGTAQNDLLNNGWTPGYDQNGGWQDCNEGSGGDYLYVGYKSSATKVDTSSLRSTYNSSSSYLDTSKYTSASVTALNNARTNAATCYNAFDNNNGVAAYTQTNINNYAAAITSAINALQTTVKLDAATNGGTTSTTSANVTIGTNTSASINLGNYTASKSGWSFVGWNKDSSATTGTKSTVTVGFNEQYYAIFSRNFTLNYVYLDPSTGTVVTDTQTKTIYNNQTTATFSATKTRSDVTINGVTYKFAGYSDSATAAAPQYTEGMFTLKTTDSSSSKTVYAIYKADISISYNSGKGSPSVAGETKTSYLASANTHPISNVSFTVSSTTPSYTGGNFGGWDTSSAASSVVWTAGETISTKYNVNLYAVYTLKEFTVKFVDEDDTVLKTQTVKYDYSATAPASPTKESDENNQYIFSNWDKSFSNVKSDLTVKAVYTTIPHDFEIAPVKLPTCTETGLDKYSCKDCDYVKTVVVSALGHKLTTEKGYDATCTTIGYTDKISCTTCGEVMQEKAVIEALGHSFGKQSTVAATCSAKGYDVYVCSACGTTEKRNETAPDYDNHSLVEIPAVEGTCTTNGKTAGTKCTVCGATIDAPKTIIAEGHKWIAATCYSPKTCSVCNKTEGDALTHIYAVSPAKDATCTTDGYTEGRRCTLCGDIPEGSVVTVIPAEGHKWTVTEKIDATCTAKGKITSVCDVCEEVKVEKTPVIDHTEVAIPETEASCTAQGSKGGTMCDVCGKVLTEPVTTGKLEHPYVKIEDTVEPTCSTTGKTAVYECSVCGFTKGGTTVSVVDHTYGAWVTLTASTCTENGLRVKYCKYCGKNVTSVVEAIGHVAMTVKAKQPGCTTTGISAGTKCAICGEYLTGCETIGVLGHSYSVYKTVEATCTEQGYSTYKCANCGDSYDDDYTDAKGHTEVTIEAVEPTCTSIGFTAGAQCSVCNKTLVKPTSIAKTAHNKVAYGEVAATCTEGGMKAGTKCADCGRIYSEPTPSEAKGHEYDLGTITTEANCITEGVITYTCICGDDSYTVTTGYGSHSITEYESKGGMINGVCDICGVEITCNPSEVGLPDTGCEKCGIHHTSETGFFAYDGFYCRLVSFFRTILDTIKGWFGQN